MARPLVSLTVPLVIKLSPLHPGYVMRMCALEMEVKIARMKGRSNKQLSRILVKAMAAVWSVLGELYALLSRQAREFNRQVLFQLPAAVSELRHRRCKE